MATEKSKDELVGQLLAKFPAFDLTWPQETQARWFAGYEKLLGRILEIGEDSAFRPALLTGADMRSTQ